MTPPLTVRNLTATPILLKGIERFEDPNSLQSKPSAFSFASNTTTSLAPTSPRLGEHARSFNHEDLDVTLAPLESWTLHINEDEDEEEKKAPSTLSNTTIRLTIEIPNGERYRIDTNPSYTQKASHSFTPLSPNPSTSYQALYHPANPSSNLTIHSNHLYDLSKWMATLPSTLPLSAISIPGTHNSHAHYRALPSVRCQVVDIKTQLENGIRFLDIRLQPAHATDASKKDLYLVHGAFPVSLTGNKLFEPVLQTIYAFLAHNPSETVLLSLKREGVGSSTDAHLSEILDRHYIAPSAAKWHTGPSIPYLGSVRGKIVLVRRYDLHSPPPASASPSAAPPDDTAGFGLDATVWPYNTTHAHHGPFCIQDFCEVLHPSSIGEKLRFSNEHLGRAAECVALVPGVNTDSRNPVPAGPVYLNFCSGSNFWNPACWPGKISKVVNRGLEEWVVRGHHLVEPVAEPGRPGEGAEGIREGMRRAKEGDGGTGVVVMDFVGEGQDWDLVRLIIGLNMGVVRRVGSEK